MDDLVRLVERLRERSQSINHEAADAIEQLQRQLADAVKANESLPEDALGVGGDGNGTHWYLRDELLHNLRAAIRERT